MGARIIPRAESGLPAKVTSFNHITLRPFLAPLLGLVVGHWPGTNTRYHGMTQAEVAAVIRAVNRWKPNEYNYVIDWAGRVYEFAGVRQAAHAKGYNDGAYGVLFLCGNDEQPTLEMIGAWHFLIAMLMMGQRINTNPFLVPHRWMAATACPGAVASYATWNPRGPNLDDRWVADLMTYRPDLHSLADERAAA
jgi:hypothetical protein